MRDSQTWKELSGRLFSYDSGSCVSNLEAGVNIPI